jgi:hypothetical protein
MQGLTPERVISGQDSFSLNIFNIRRIQEALVREHAQIVTEEITPETNISRRYKW